MNTCPEYDDIIAAWRKALRMGIAPNRAWDAPSQREQAYWEGSQAYRELQTHELLELLWVADPEHVVTEHGVESIAAELKRFQENLNKVRDKHELEKDLDEWLAMEVKRFKQRARRHRSSEWAKRISRYAKHLEGERRVLKCLSRRHWFFPPTVGGTLFPGTAVIPLQERQLDTQFCIRAAMVFRTYIREISLTTIARLVILLLASAKLARPDGHGVVLNHNSRRLKTRTVLQILRRARLK